MIRNLKVILAAALALSALGAIAASAHAADEFHCSVNPCRFRALPDGTTKTEHQVFIVENEKAESVSFTCEKITGEGTVSSLTATQVTFTNIKYPNCTVSGTPGVEVDMMGCSYLFTGAGGRSDLAEVHVECPAGQAIRVNIPEIGCTFSIGEQRLTGIGYHTIGTTPNREVTVTSNVAGIATTENAACESLIKGTLIGHYTTGNAIVTGETDPGEVMADAWYE